MHVRGARRTGRAAGAHGRHAGSVRRAGRTSVLGQQARAVAGVRVCAAMGVLFAREHVLHPKSPK
ncbi:hypothetical protein CRG98_046536 [Punica granatum]|uniref:Uncharacterized protein n=1 Tax=Punica granatum TaxID=22663 RepID=A0A2I0HNC0_PUNGR|nr:hypothetical protein CRG98_046536 [Punica granatum]